MRAVNTRMKLPQNGFKKTHTLEIAPHFLCILSLLCTWLHVFDVTFNGFLPAQLETVCGLNISA